MSRSSARPPWVTAAAIWLALLTACAPAAPAATAIPTSTTAPTATPSPTPQTGLQAVNGTQLYYEIIGQGAPLFVLHGSSGSHRYFLPYLEPLANNYQLVFYDQRGTGLSDGQLDLSAITIGQFVEDLEALRVALGYQKISLMAHSWGAIIAVAYALKYQAQLEHLILVDAFPLNPTFGQAFSQTMQQRFQQLSADDQHTWATTCLHPVAALSSQDIDACNQIDARMRFSDPAKAAGADWGTDKNTLKNSDTVRGLLNTSLQKMQSDLNAQLPTLRVPTLIIHGDFDPIPLASAEYLQQHIPGSQLVPVAHSGHFPFIEQPESFGTAVRAFLGQ